MHPSFVSIQITYIPECLGTCFAFEALWSVVTFFVFLQPPRTREHLETRCAFEVPWSVHSGLHPRTFLWTRNSIRLQSVRSGRGYLTAVYCDNRYATTIIPFDHLSEMVGKKEVQWVQYNYITHPHAYQPRFQCHSRKKISQHPDTEP